MLTHHGNKDSISYLVSQEGQTKKIISFINVGLKLKKTHRNCRYLLLQTHNRFLFILKFAFAKRKVYNFTDLNTKQTCSFGMLLCDNIIYSVLDIQFFFKFFNWRIIALQNFVVFCHISTRISHRYTHVSCLPDLPPISLPTPLFNLLKSRCLSSLSHTANSHI